jgi:hypothetical protein
VACAAQAGALSVGYSEYSLCGVLGVLTTACAAQARALSVVVRGLAHARQWQPTDPGSSAFIRQIQTVALISHIFAVGSPVFHPELQECLRTGDHAKLDKASFAAPAAPAAPGNTRAHAHPPY